MKVRKLKGGDVIEVGDRVRQQTYLGVSWYQVHRVTKHYAFVRWNEVAEGKFKRSYSDFDCESIPHQKWSTTQWSVWRPTEAKQPPQGTVK